MRALKILICLISQVICLQSSETEWVVGTASGYAPFASLSEQGELEGFDIEVARDLARRMKRTLVLQDLGSINTLAIALEKSKIDSIIWAMSITPERSQKMRMLHYQGAVVRTVPLLFYQQIPEGVDSLADLAKRDDLRVAVEAGSMQETFLRSIEGLQLHYTDTISQGLLDLRFGKVTALIIDPSLTQQIVAKCPDMRVLDITLPEQFCSYGHGICLRLGDSALAKALEQAITEMKQDGTLERLEERWGLQ